MKTLLALTFAGVCTAAGAQTPASNPMPDGSRDLYIGLGAVSEPTYIGGDERRVRAMPLVQLEYSNGVFISGMSAGMHLSQQPSLEYGPLLALQGRRTESGFAAKAGGVTPAIPGTMRPSTTRMSASDQGLAGMDEIKARLQAGVFMNYYLSPTVRMTNSLLYGAGKWHDGLVWNLGLQHTAADITEHHRFTFGAGVTLANNSYITSFYGVTAAEALRRGHGAYRAGSGVQDLYLGAGWNWALSPHWMLARGARVTRLQGDARHSPLVQRPTSFSISTGLAYRF
jgi:outer membrane protein